MRLEAGVLSGNPITELRFKSLPARSTAGLIVTGPQGLVMLDRQDHRVELTRLFDEHRFAFRLGGQATKSVLCFGGSDANDETLELKQSSVA